MCTYNDEHKKSKLDRKTKKKKTNIFVLASELKRKQYLLYEEQNFKFCVLRFQCG